MFLRDALKKGEFRAERAQDKRFRGGGYRISGWYKIVDCGASGKAREGKEG